MTSNVETTYASNGEEEVLYKRRFNERELFCKPCLYGNQKIIATFFCKTCATPEPLCDDCAEQHCRQKLSRDHELCEGMTKYPNQVIKDQDESNTQQDTLLCDPCLYGSKKNTATHFCTTCDVPEPLCVNCAQQHTRQRISRDHQLCDNINVFPNAQKNSNPEGNKKNTEVRTVKSTGKPQPINIYSDSVELFWEKPDENVDHFQLWFKAKNKNSRWKFIETESDENHLTVSGLMANTKYAFKVYSVFMDEGGQYGPENEDIETKMSLAKTLVGCSTLQKETSPALYLLPFEEDMNARNVKARTRHLVFGTPNRDFYDEKTIMLVGSTGSGKSTLVDGIANYITGVSFEDPFRFKMVTLENDEEKTHNQAVSQTEWITVYTIHPMEGSRLSYTLNIIDTPGFGDTRGLERDSAIVDQIRHLFSAKEDHSILNIDAVCFIVKAPDARLTGVQKYIFSSIMSLFGKDIGSNICTLITFADGSKPSVLASLQESNLPFGLNFNFNNSALFADSKDVEQRILSAKFWEMGCSSFQKFFDHMSHFETKSLKQTTSVLNERERLKSVILNLRPQIQMGLLQLEKLKKQKKMFLEHSDLCENNKDYEYTEYQSKPRYIDLPRGQYVTNCFDCHTTCHENCKIPDSKDKKGCLVIDQNTGKCTVCPGNCYWDIHKNNDYIFKMERVEVKVTTAGMKKKYEEALGKQLSDKKYIESMTNDLKEMSKKILEMLEDSNKCKSKLKEIALRPDPLSTVDHIDSWIRAEELDKQAGYLDRIKSLEEMKKVALIEEDAHNVHQEMYTTLNETESDIKEEKKKSLLARLFQM